MCQEQGGPNQPRLVVAALVAGSLLVGGHGGELVEPEGAAVSDETAGP